jgi:hypothetical protein
LETGEMWKKQKTSLKQSNYEIVLKSKSSCQILLMGKKQKMSVMLSVVRSVVVIK